MIRPARSGEAAAITDLALRSKRRWGYADDFMAAVAADLRVTEADIETDHIEVLEADDRMLGFYQLQRKPGHAHLEKLFVDPAGVGSGHGRRLFDHAVEIARGWGYETLLLDSDPNAEGFYRSLGAERIGRTPSPVVPGRWLPLMRYRLP
jgi:GNAT superfamily N-acetyltransferase